MELTSVSAASALNSATGVAKATSLMMLKKTMDSDETMGAALIQMMEQSVNPGLGANIDAKV